MAMAIIHHPQSRANLLREMLRRDPLVRRTGIQFVKVEGTDDVLRLLVRKGAGTVRLGRGPEWRAVSLERLKQNLRAELTTLAKSGALLRHPAQAAVRPTLPFAGGSAGAWVRIPGRC